MNQTTTNMQMDHVASRPDAWKYRPVSMADKRVLVTGGTTGIGRSTALLLAQQGARVLVFGRDREHLEDALTDLRPYHERVNGMTADVTDTADLERVFQRVDERFGGLDILINCAGVPAESVLEQRDQSYHYVLETNLLGFMRCADAAANRMPADGRGHIVNIGSMSAESRGAGSDIYVATKSGIRGWSKALGKQLAERKIRVTLIEPGLVGTDFFPDEQSDPDAQRHMRGEQKMMASEDIAESVLYCLTLPVRANAVMLQIHQLQKD